MKKYATLMLMIAIATPALAQKMTIKAANGQTIEISCENGLTPKEVAIAPDGTVTFKINGDSAPAEIKADNATVADSLKVEPEPELYATADSLKAESDSIITEMPQSEANSKLAEADNAEADSLALAKSIAASGNTTAGIIANSLVRELSPEYAEFQDQYGNTKMASEKDVYKAVAKQFVDEDVVEGLDFFGTLLSGLRLTKDSTFVPTYAQRKPRLKWRAYNTIKVSGSIGKDIASINPAVAEKITESDYGDDTENSNKYGGSLDISRTYLFGKTDANGEWKPNPLYFAWSWGGLISYQYENEIGSYLNLMGKVGVQIGQDICLGVDALFGAGVTPYNTFLSNDMNHHIVNKSVWCGKVGVQAWGSLNASRDTYTIISAQYITSIKPNTGEYNLSPGWEVVADDFDPSCWNISLGVGYKFGAPETVRQDKRLQVGLKLGYHLAGNNGTRASIELNRLTQVSKSTTLSYGLSVENIFEKKEDGGNCSALLGSFGFNVCQPLNAWFWGTKVFAGVGEYPIIYKASSGNYNFEDYSKKLCAKCALELGTGFKFGKKKLTALTLNIRAGAHFGKEMKFEGFNEDVRVRNLSGFDLSTSLGYSIIF